jgi:SAM-dependent methyltransferase
LTTFKWHATTPLTIDEARHFWEVRYEHAVTPWDRGATSPALTHWLDNGNLKPCRILIPGCGRGYEVIELAQRGYEVTALDISPLAIETVAHQLQQAGLTASLIETDLFKWMPKTPLDAIYDQTCLCALLPEQWSAYVQRLAQWLRPGGELFALFMQTDKSGGPPFHCEIEAMKELFAYDAWIWPNIEPKKTPHSSGFFELAVILKRK